MGVGGGAEEGPGVLEATAGSVASRTAGLRRREPANPKELADGAESVSSQRMPIRAAASLDALQRGYGCKWPARGVAIG